jgi:hypothetical protein
MSVMAILRQLLSTPIGFFDQRSQAGVGARASTPDYGSS